MMEAARYERSLYSRPAYSRKSSMDTADEQNSYSSSYRSTRYADSVPTRRPYSQTPRYSAELGLTSGGTTTTRPVTSSYTSAYRPGQTSSSQYSTSSSTSRSYDDYRSSRLPERRASNDIPSSTRFTPSSTNSASRYAERRTSMEPTTSFTPTSTRYTPTTTKYTPTTTSSSRFSERRTSNDSSSSFTPSSTRFTPSSTYSSSRFTPSSTDRSTRTTPSSTSYRYRSYLDPETNSRRTEPYSSTYTKRY